jgi:FlaA1/EpsC-like NDP-sugar epimerase
MGLGFYQRVHNRTLGQTRARAILSLCLSLSLAYIIFLLSPLSPQDEKTFLLALILAVALMLIHRIYMAHATPRAMMRQRVLVFGSGERAKLVGRTLKNSDPSVDLVGYYASPNEAVAEISGWALLSPQKSLTDIVIDERVDEIVVALSERRACPCASYWTASCTVFGWLTLPLTLKRLLVRFVVTRCLRVGSFLVTDSNKGWCALWSSECLICCVRRF